VALANAAACTRLAGELVAPAMHPSVLKMPREIASGRLAPPARLSLSLDCASGATARLDGLVIEGPNQHGAVLIADPDVPAASTLPPRHVSELIDAELLALVDAFTADQIFGDDRIVLHELVAEVWRDVEPTARALRVTVSTVGLDDSLPPIYGSRRWLARAVHECLDNALRHARAEVPGNAPASAVEIGPRRSGPLLMLRVTHPGVGRLPALGDRVLLPFSDTAPATRAASSREPATRIGLPLAQRILQRHGGRMRIGADEHDDTTVLVLELPTGAPRRASQMGIEQAQRHAADLAKMTAASHGRRAPSAAQAAQTETTR
jgi:hypothetical protein